MTTAEANVPATETYNALVQIDGAHVSVQAPTLTVLSALIARLKGAAPSPAVGAAEKQEVAPAAAGKPKAAPTAAAQASSKSVPDAGEPASPAPSPAASDTPAAEPKPVGYDDVKRVVNALYAIDAPAGTHAVKLLADFGVKKGTELQPQQWPDVVAEGEKRLAALKG